MSRPDSENVKDVREVLKDCGTGFGDRLKDCKGMFEREDWETCWAGI